MVWFLGHFRSIVGGWNWSKSAKSERKFCCWFDHLLLFICCVVILLDNFGGIYLMANIFWVDLALCVYVVCVCVCMFVCMYVCVLNQTWPLNAIMWRHFESCNDMGVIAPWKMWFELRRGWRRNALHSFPSWWFHLLQPFILYVIPSFFPFPLNIMNYPIANSPTQSNNQTIKQILVAGGCEKKKLGIGSRIVVETACLNRHQSSG